MSKGNPENQYLADRAKWWALRRLADMYPRDYVKLLEEEYANRGIKITKRSKQQMRLDRIEAARKLLAEVDGE